MSPSSLVSVGMCSSNRTLEVGSVHRAGLEVLLLIEAQFPVAEEPFTEVGVRKVYSKGMTMVQEYIRH